MDVIGSRALTAEGYVRLSPGHHARPGQTITVACESLISLGATVQHRARPLPAPSGETPLVIKPEYDPLPPPAPPLLVALDGRPHAPLLELPSRWMGAPYPPDDAEGYRQVPAGPVQTEPALWFGNAHTPATLPRHPYLDHFARRTRDTLHHPYAAGIKDGIPYVRLVDVPLGPSGTFFLGRGQGRVVPYDGAQAWAVPSASSLSRYLDNPTMTTSLTFFQKTDRAIILGEPATYKGHELWFGNLVTDVVATLPYRTLIHAALTPTEASVTRVYQDGTLEPDGTAAAIDLTIRPMDWDGASATREGWVRVHNEFGVASGAYLAGTFSGNLSNPQTEQTFQFLGDSAPLVWEQSLLGPLSFPPVEDARDTPIGSQSGTRAGPHIAVHGWLAGTPGVTDEMQPVSDDTLPQAFPITMRYRDVGGQPATWESSLISLNTGRLVYEGPLGVLPAPNSGRTETWCDLTVVADQDFTADAWVERDGTRCALIVYANGAAAVSTAKGGVLKRWSGTLADLLPPGAALPAALPDSTLCPALSYTFLQPGWPFSTGALAWADVRSTLPDGGFPTTGTYRLTRLRARMRRGPIPVLLLPDLTEIHGSNLEQPHAGHVLPGGRYALPSGGADAALLAPLRLPGPREPGWTGKPTLVTLSAPATLTFTAGWTLPADETTTAALTGIEVVMRARDAPRLSTPAGWTRQLSRVLGTGTAIVRLDAPDPQPPHFTLPAGVPVGHVRARLEPQRSSP